jgi:methionyl aminopeptidase
MHEAPGVPNYGRKGHGARLAEGLVICIEPMICAGGRGVYLARNGWAVHTADHRNAAHYELTVVVRKGRAEQLSTFDFIEKDSTDVKL